MHTGQYPFSQYLSGNHRFAIPSYQRNYSWDRRQLQDLWQDLNERLDKTHYFGTFLVQEGESEARRDTVYDIIDGQQRMTSTLILLFELHGVLSEEGYEDEAEDIVHNYLVQGGKYKLTLMGSDEAFFKDYILEGITDETGRGRRETGPAADQLDTPSRRRLWEAKSYFKTRLEEKQEGLEGEAFVYYGLDLLEKIEEMETMVYTVNSRADAVRIFQTVNDRGKRLSDLEKTKSFLMHRLYLSISEDEEDLLNEEINRVQRDFGNIYEHIEAINDTEQGDSISEDDVQRYHFILWNDDWTTSRDGRYYQNHLGHIKELFGPNGPLIDEDVTAYTEELERAFHALRQIVDPDNIDNRSLKNRLTKLFSIGRIGNFYPLLIAGWMQYIDDEVSEEEMVTLLDRIETFIVRVYVVRQMAAYTGRTKIYTLARRFYRDSPVRGNHALDIEQTANILANHIHDYCDDDDLRRILAENDVYTYYSESNRLNELRYLLYHCERALEDELEGIHMDVRDVVKNPDDQFTIEHIWPQSPDRLSLGEDEQELHEANKHRLGNLALMTAPWNASESNKPYQTKRERYLESRIRMLNKVACENDTWGVEEIDTREQEMLDAVLERWPDVRAPAPASTW